VRWLLLIVIAACGGAPIKHNGPAWIEKIKLEGNKAIDDDDVVPRLALERVRQGGRAVDYYQLTLDTERVRQAYVRKGYLDVKVTSKVYGVD
jgi:outer membrane protein assembly factor BamA